MANILYEKLTRLQWLLHKKQLRSWDENGPLADTTRGQGRILSLLKLRDGISTKDLSYLLGVRVSSLNELLSKLEKNGYVTREPSDEDKRVMLVKLTDKGRDEQQPEPLGFEDIFSCLSDEEQVVFGENLDRIAIALHADVGDDSEEMLRHLESVRAKYWESGEFLAGLRHGFPKGRGVPHDPGSHRPGSHRPHPHDPDPYDSGSHDPRGGFSARHFRNNEYGGQGDFRNCGHGYGCGRDTGPDREAL